MASREEIELAFRRSGIGRGPSGEEISYYSSYPDAGKVEGDIRWQMDNPGGSYGGSSGGGGVAGDYISSIAGLIGKVPEPYETKNPFFFDEKLAKEASTAEYAPYYQEMLSDYVANIERTKSRSTEDLKRTLEFLGGGKEYFLGRERRLLDKAIKSTSEGYAGKNLFFSGAREKDIKELQQESEAGVGEYMRGYGYKTGEAELAQKRTAEDEELKQRLYTRETEREKKYAVEQGILQRKGETRDEYELSRKKYYSQFPAYYGGLA